jgi:hypothetical protein
VIVSLLHALVLLGAVATPAPSDIGMFVGTWRGTSTCVNREFAPACKDEVVVYEVTRTDKPGVAHLKAYKIVNGEKGLMGEFDYTFDAKNGCWAGEFRNERVHIVHRLKIEGTRMTGTLSDVATGTKVREMALKRD